MPLIEKHKSSLTWKSNIDTDKPERIKHINRFLVLLCIMVAKTNKKNRNLEYDEPKPFSDYISFFRYSDFSSEELGKSLYPVQPVHFILEELYKDSNIKLSRNDKKKLFTLFNKYANESKRLLSRVTYALLSAGIIISLISLLLARLFHVGLFESPVYLMSIPGISMLGCGIYGKLLIQEKIISINHLLLFLVHSSDCMNSLENEKDTLEALIESEKTELQSANRRTFNKKKDSVQFVSKNYETMSREQKLSIFLEKYRIPSHFFEILQHIKYNEVILIDCDFNINRNYLSLFLTYLNSVRNERVNDNKLIAALFHLQDIKNLSSYVKSYKSDKLIKFEKFLEHNERKITANLELISKKTV